jgi:hypothetical protein
MVSKNFLNALVDSTFDSVKTKRKFTQQVHFAVIIKRNKVIAMANNKFSNFLPHLWSLHAERAVVRNLGNMEKLRGSILFVWRSTETTKKLDSEPCPNCRIFLQSLIDKWGLKCVIFT